MALAITKAQSGKRIAYHHRTQWARWLRAKIPAAGKSGNKAEAKEKQKNLLTWNENLVKVGSRWEKPAKQEMLVGSLEIWDLSCPSLNIYSMRYAYPVKVATGKKQSQYIGKKVFRTTTRQDCSLQETQRCAKVECKIPCQSMEDETLASLCTLPLWQKHGLLVWRYAPKMRQTERKFPAAGKRETSRTNKQSARKIKR